MSLLQAICVAALAMLVPSARSSAFGALDDPSARIAAYADGLEGAGFSGVIVVARGGEPLLVRGMGMAERESGRRIGARTAMHLGSVTKSFTAAAILQLEQEGLLAVTDAIARFLPEVPEDKRAITIHQLLTHTSGLPGSVGPCSSRATEGRDEHVAKILGAELAHEPGTAHLYSNTGYALLGALVELISGLPYDRYLRERLFAPAGMERSGYELAREPAADVARGYRGEEERLGMAAAWAGDGPIWCTRASGGLLSTAEDMLRWHLALRAGELFPAETLARYVAPHVAETPDATSHYAYGWAVFTTPRGTRLVAHDGNISDVFTADCRWFADEDAFVFVAANTAEHPSKPVARELSRLLFDAR